MRVSVVKVSFPSMKRLIYQGFRITNWCPRCQTALSDIEVEHEDEVGHLWYFNYPIAGEEGKYIQIATTRPETIPGDTAVAVNPEDERYKDLVGKKVALPGTGREIPIIADEYVDMAYGTGCVKITPAHDPNDFEVGQRHQLETIVIMNKDGTMNEKAGKYVGMDRYEARKASLLISRKPVFSSRSKKQSMRSVTAPAARPSSNR